MQKVGYLAVDPTLAKNLTGNTEYLADLAEYCNPDHSKRKNLRKPE
jgi:hypothetical protein